MRILYPCILYPELKMQSEPNNIHPRRRLEHDTDMASIRNVSQQSSSSYAQVSQVPLHQIITPFGLHATLPDLRSVTPVASPNRLTTTSSLSRQISTPHEQSFHYPSVLPYSSFQGLDITYPQPANTNLATSFESTLAPSGNNRSHLNHDIHVVPPYLHPHSAALASTNPAHEPPSVPYFRLPNEFPEG